MMMERLLERRLTDSLTKQRPNFYRITRKLLRRIRYVLINETTYEMGLA